jgi:SET and MYND domain-containing protein
MTGNRCKAELKEQSSLLKGTEKLSTLPRHQQDIVQLIGAAIKASKYPGVFPDFEDPAAVETKLRTITVNAFPAGKHWPEHMEPLPSARLSLAMLYLEKGQPVPALRNALKGQLLSIRKKGPEWVNDMMDIITILIVAASLPPDSPAFKDKKFPPATDLQNVTLGYFVAAAYEASGMFGSGAEYAKGISHMTSVMGAQKGPPLPGTKEFIEVFVPAQRRLLEWAGIPEGDAIVIRGV